MSKKKLSEEAMIARIHITALEAGTQCPSMNVVFYLSEALDMKPDVFSGLFMYDPIRINIQDI